jgi:hypothetical protein
MERRMTMLNNGKRAKREKVVNLLDHIATIRQSIAKAKEALPEAIVREIERMEAEEEGLAKEARALAVELGEVVEGESLKVTLTAPRETVNIEKLKGFILVHPEAAELIEVGSQTARIVTKKGKA